MQDKLQELTDRLYAEGLAKGKEEGENIVANAKAEAQKIMADARAEADRLRAEAAKDAEDLKTKTMADIRMASNQSLAVVRQALENLLLAHAVEQPVAQALAKEEFVKELLRSIVASFNPQNAEPADLNVIIPDKLQQNLTAFLENELSDLFKTEVKVGYSKKMSSGFAVAPKDGRYFIRFTDEEFKELLSSYLRPVTKKILFG